MEKIAGFLFMAFQLSGAVPAYTSPAVKHTAVYSGDTSLPDTSLQKTVRLTARKVPTGASIEWTALYAPEAKEINVQCSSNGKNFSTINTLKPGSNIYTDNWLTDKTSAHYRVEVIWSDGSKVLSNVVLVSSVLTPSSIVLVTNPIADVAKLRIINCCAQLFMAEWRNSQGTMIETQTFNVSMGNNRVELVPPPGIVSGTYYLRVVSDDKKQRQLFRVMKQ